jgi:hypothetical protein
VILFAAVHEVRTLRNVRFSIGEPMWVTMSAIGEPCAQRGAVFDATRTLAVYFCGDAKRLSYPPVW